MCSYDFIATSFHTLVVRDLFHPQILSCGLHCDHEWLTVLQTYHSDLLLICYLSSRPGGHKQQWGGPVVSLRQHTHVLPLPIICRGCFSAAPSSPWAASPGCCMGMAWGIVQKLILPQSCSAAGVKPGGEARRSCQSVRHIVLQGWGGKL